MADWRVRCEKWVRIFGGDVPDLHASSVAFAQIPKAVVPLTARSLYVGQKEICFCGLDEGFEFVGSDDATTCLLLVARCPQTDRIACTHMDSRRSARDLAKVLKAGLIGEANTISSFVVEIWLVGAIPDDDSKDGSDDLVQKVVGELKNQEAWNVGSPVIVNIRVACVLEVNSRPIPDDEDGHTVPISMGIAATYNGNSFAVVPAFWPPNARGPEIPLRTGRLWADEKNLTQIYPREGRPGMVGITPYTPGTDGQEEFQTLLDTEDDSEFKEEVSSSPWCEPDHFVSEVKAAMRFYLEHISSWNSVFLRGPLFFQPRLNGATGYWEWHQEL
ncbi:protein N-terminal asparagine amidohydrolase [Pelomyxa schiedti]|nr:protein N-terminal asparagine amidohydrolase [Pelomyxa schiedti]